VIKKEKTRNTLVVGVVSGLVVGYRYWRYRYQSQYSHTDGVWT